MESIGEYPTKEMIDKMMYDYDDDGNEVIDFDEFVRMILKYNVELRGDPITELSNAIK